MPTKIKVVRFKLSENLAIIDDYERSQSLRQVAAKWKCHYSTVAKILKKKSKLLAIRDEGGSSTATTFRESKFEAVDAFLWQCHNEARSRLIPTSLAIYRGKAAQFAADANIANFSSSTGWLTRFFKRHGISHKAVTGESGGVDQALVEIWTIERLPALLAGYNLEDIFNADEFGLWYQMLPSNTYAASGDACKGEKQSKVRLTVLIGANATGTDKLKPLMIGTAKNPRCFKNIDKTKLPGTWWHNTTAWMNTSLFENWLNTVNDDMKRQKRKILMLIDNAPSHPDMNLSNVNVAFLPPNTTSVTQPCDAGIIKDLKAKFRILLMQKIISVVDSDTTAAEIAKTINVQDAVEWIAKAWQQVKPVTIQHCFEKVGVKKTTDAVMPLNNDPEYVQMQNLIKAFFAKVKINGPAIDATAQTVEAYITCDDNVPVMDELGGGGWEDALTQQFIGASGAYVVEDDDEDEIMEVNVVEAEPKILSLKKINVILESFTYTMQSRYPSIYEKFALFRDEMRSMTPLEHNLVQKNITEFFKVS